MAKQSEGEGAPMPQAGDPPKDASAKRRAGAKPGLASPAAAGPAGAALEAHVGAQYLLPLLSGGEARGLPGVVVTRVAFQRAGLGNPMDDIVVSGHDARGSAATFEIQAKRTVAFTSADAVFADVVAFAVRAASKPAFDAQRYELAVAIARSSTKVDQHIQEVLKWVREYQQAEGFFRRLAQPRVAHQAMRDFVEAFRGHMRTADAAHDDAAVWGLLRRFQVLAYDFEQPGSMCALYARERCAALLTPAQTGRAGDLWTALQQRALEVDAVGGDVDGESLHHHLTSEHSFTFAGDRRLHAARERLAEMSDAALDDISTTVHGVCVERSQYVGAAEAALDQGRYLELRGEGGLGKSGVLKRLAQRLALQSRVVVVAPSRVPGGGWAALQQRLGCDASASQFMTDLAGDGAC